MKIKKILGIGNGFILAIIIGIILMSIAIYTSGIPTSLGDNDNNWLPPGPVNIVAVLIYSVIGTILISIYLWVREKLKPKESN